VSNQLAARGSYSGAFPLSDGVPSIGGAGVAIQIIASVAGTVTLTLLDGSTIPVTVPIGTTTLPYMVTKATAGTATVTSYYNLRGTGTAA
jgi:hypothetical protein